ncbi:MAG: S9 family peptidase [Gemmatimonadetes bacterium]|nr:S9 family peptidase [Gemmatimonadota bacterium]
MRTLPRLLLSAALVACGGKGSPGAPATRISLVVDTLHGVAVEDPYRWLEEQGSSEVRDWIAAQQRYADSVMGPTSPLRDSLMQRLTELMDVPNASAPRRAGAHEYFTLRKRGEATAAIYRRPAPKESGPVDVEGTYEKVVDPLAIRDDGTTSVEIIGFTGDGRRLMYSVRDGGPDEITVKVRDLTTMQDLPDSLPAALYASLSFAPDGKGIYFVHRSRTDGPRFKYHALGTDPASDSVLFGNGLAPTAFLNVTSAEGGKYRLMTVGHGWASNEVFVLETKTGTRYEITEGVAAHFAPQFVDGSLWMRTDLDAPRGRVVRVDLANPARDQWKEVIAQGDQVLDGFQVIDSLVWVTWIKDVGHQVTTHTKAGVEVDRIEVRPGSSVTLRGGPKGTLYLTETGFDRPSVTYTVDRATKARAMHEPSKVPFDSGTVEVTQVWYTSKDGTRAPMWVMSKRGAARSATTPALLNGYGGFALSLLPRFDARAAAWVERGGVYAQATLRGGNEFGEEWHKGGMLLNKQNVFDDFNAAAQYLVDSGYTSPAHLAIRGGSNGGLLMGAAITQRPDLYRAAFVGVPDLDMVRFYTFRTHNNMPALLEYGDASRKEEFAAIIKHSPYQAVRDGARYPAVFVQTGINDTRVPPWQARRFTARLQAATGSREPVILYHDLRSGHAGGRSNAGGIELATKELEFLWSRTAKE